MDQAIHNYLLSLYIEQEDDLSLLRYLQMQGQVSIDGRVRQWIKGKV